MNYLDDVFKQTADGGYFDFARCQKPNGQIYGTRGKCRSGVEIGAKEETTSVPKAAPAAKGAVKLGGAKVGTEKRLLSLSVSQLKQLREDPRLYDYQKKKIDSIIAKKESEAPDPGRRTRDLASAVSAKVQKKSKNWDAKIKADAEAKKAAERVKHENIANEVMTDKKFRSDKARKAEMIRRGVPADTDFVALVADAKKRRGDDGGSEDKAAKKWQDEGKKLEEIKKKHDEIMKQVEAETGHTVSWAGGAGANEMHRRLKAAGLPSRDQLSKMQLQHGKTEPESLKTARLAKAEEERQAGLKMSKEERRAQIREMMKDIPNQWYGKDIASLTQSIETLKGFMREPSLDTIEYRNKLVALRALRMKLVAAEQASRRALAIDAQAAVKGAPTYSSTPGASRPLANAAKKLGPHAQRFLEAKSEWEAVDAQIKKLEATGKTYEELKKEGIRIYQLDERRDTLRGELIRMERAGDFIKLGDIYREQGFNAKPELVATRGDLERRNDLATHRDGTPIIAFRGVTEMQFADQFRGIGPEGDTHFAGKGVYGDGTYAAAAPAGKTKDVAVKTAQSYASSAEGTNARVTAFGFRQDANLVMHEGATQSERYDNYAQWQRSITQAASDRTGLPINDTGYAAAIMGIHAYQVPQGYEEDYWVILNRGATIQAVDAQI